MGENDNLRLPYIKVQFKGTLDSFHARAFKGAPRLIVRAKDMHYFAADGRALLDGSAGSGAPTRDTAAILSCTRSGSRRANSTTRRLSSSAIQRPLSSPPAAASWRLAQSMRPAETGGGKIRSQTFDDLG